jgi:hypothetical protein
MVDDMVCHRFIYGLSSVRGCAFGSRSGWCRTSWSSEVGVGCVFGRYLGSEFGSANFICGRVLPIFTGSFFHFSVDFYPFWSIPTVFETGFFPFSLFSDFQTRYTRTAEGMLMYSPSGKRVKAGQLGPSAYRFLFCVFRD